MTKEPLLAIRCITYNHEPYIRQCLEGFVMQKTNFPFVAIVHDDASTDGTADIIREFEEKYPDIIKPIYETENQWSKHDGSLGRAVDAAIPECVKYIAFCEGDDYWTDPNKLQMQVDFLEKNPEYGMCYGRAKQWIQELGQFKGKIGTKGESFESLIIGNKIPTLTVVLRKELQKKYEGDIVPGNKNWKMGDYPLWIWMSKHGKIKFFPNTFAVYRVLISSASHSKDIEKNVAFRKSVYDIQVFFLEYFSSNFFVPFFDVHKIRSKENVIAGNREKAFEEFMMIESKTIKVRILTLFCKYPALFFVLRFYYKRRYGLC